MEKNIMIVSEGYEGDFHLMSLDEMIEEVKDIAMNDDGDYLDWLEWEDLEDNDINLEKYGKQKSDWAKQMILDGYYYEYHGATYCELDDSYIEEKWKELEDILFFEDKDKNLVLVSDWFIFDKKEYRDDIWHWFDKYHSKGIGWLINDFE